MQILVNIIFQVAALDVGLDGLVIRLRVQSLAHIVRDLAGIAGTARKAA